MLNTGIFSYCENVSIFVSNHPFKFPRNRPVREYFTSFFQWNVKRPSECYASLGDQVARVTRYKYFFTKCSRIVKYHHRRQEHHSKSLKGVTAEYPAILKLHL